MTKCYSKCNTSFFDKNAYFLIYILYLHRFLNTNFEEIFTFISIPYF